jgi:chorismate mutase / prephenate dehydratase
MLKDLRNKIDTIDGKITALLNARARVTLDVAMAKKEKGLSIYAPDREQDVLRKIKCASAGPLPAEALEAIYREIMSASLSLEKDLKVAYLGPEATFSHLAALKKFGSQVTYVPCNTIADVFTEVQRGSVDYGVVPIENSVEGAISYTMDMLVDSDLRICAQVMLDVSHNLLSSGSNGQIKRVYSNPQVFGQCRAWLRQNLPQAQLVEISSTTRAAQKAACEKGSACIASLLAAQVYKLKIIARDIEDSPHNITRFLVIGETIPGPTGKDKTSLLFSIKDHVGALHDMLVPFKKNRINLTKIESRPSKKKAWDYYFFVDLCGHQQEPAVRRAIGELEKKCRFLKVLGSYPV